MAASGAGAAGRIGGVRPCLSTPPFVRLCRVALVAALLAPGGALGQFNLPQPSTELPGSSRAAPAPSPRPGPPAAATLPRPSILPAPGDTTLPGIDPRQCGSTPHSALCARGRWTLFSTIDVKLSAPDFRASYALDVAQNDEVHATYRETARGKTRSGEILLIGLDGVAFRTQEQFPAGAPVLDIMISMPIMAAQLAALLLDEGVIGPPADVTAPRAVKAASDTRYIRTAAPNAVILYGPPWRMTGSVRPGATRDDVAFALKLAYRPVDSKGTPVAGRTDTLTLEGRASFAPRPASLPDSFELAEFTVLRDDQPLGAQRTVGDARRALGP